MKRGRLQNGLLFGLVCLLFVSAARGEEKRIPPARPVPDYVQRLLQVASEEVGYTEDHGRTKYGAWAGDPGAQWCAEFLCWCVDQVDQRWGYALLRNVYPFYTSSNTGRDWFLRAGRYVVRQSPADGWGEVWLKGASRPIQSGDYIPQPGDWVFFSSPGGTDTRHVALVEYCARETETGAVAIHVIEGNLPSAVARNTYDLNSAAILGYGTVHDVADITLMQGHQGEKVRRLQEKLAYLSLLDESQVSGRFGAETRDAVKRFQAARGLRENGVATMETQLLLDSEFTARYEADPAVWLVTEP